MINHSKLPLYLARPALLTAFAGGIASGGLLTALVVFLAGAR